MKNAILPSAILLVAACGGSEPTATEHGDSHAEHQQMHESHNHAEHGEENPEHDHAELPPEIDSFHNALREVWHSEPGDGRAALACENAGTFGERAEAVAAMQTPADADETGFRSATDQLVAGATALSTSCENGPAADTEEKLSSLHDAFHGLTEAIGHQ